MMITTTRWGPRTVTAAAAAAMLGLTLAACSDEGGPEGVSDDCPDGVTSITLSGPNQWTSDGDTFGESWENLVASFHEVEPCVELTTNVLPADTYNQALSTQLAAGSATELVFSQANHDPYMVHSLTEELEQPNPYVEGNERWIDLFNPDYYTVDKVANSEGNAEYIPFNLVGVALFYNADAFDEAGVGNMDTFEDFLAGCDDLSEAGYIPVAMDNGPIGIGWTTGALTAQFFNGEIFDEWNVYDASGEPGTAEILTPKSIGRAMATGEFVADMPQVRESLEQLKRFFDHCVSPDWSGTASTGAFVGGQLFPSGEAAMAWSSNFGVNELGTEFEVGSMPFPTITQETSDLVTGEPARFGTGLGGTAYMIPSTVEGAEYDAALKFLQFASSPEHVQPWLDTSGGVPVLLDAEVPENVSGFLDGEWAEPFRLGYGILQTASTTTNTNLFSGYLLGTKPLEDQIVDLQANYDDRIREDARNHPEWADEDWYQG